MIFCAPSLSLPFLSFSLFCFHLLSWFFFILWTSLLFSRALHALHPHASPLIYKYPLWPLGCELSSLVFSLLSPFPSWLSPSPTPPPYLPCWPTNTIFILLFYTLQTLPSLIAPPSKHLFFLLWNEGRESPLFSSFHFGYAWCLVRYI